MPFDDAVDAELERRALRLARRAAAEQATHVVSETVVFAVGQEQFAVPAPQVREIVMLPKVTPLPGLPPWIRGVAALRGELVTVVDTGAWLGIAAASPSTHGVWIQGGRGALALTAQRIVGFRVISAAELATDWVASLMPARHKTIDLVTLVDVDLLLADARLSVG